MATIAELAHQRDQLRTKRARRTKLHQRLLDRAHKAAVAARVAARRIAGIQRRIQKKKAAKPHGLSSDGAGFIARFEGEVDHAYDDAAGHCTIAIGHLLDMRTCSASGHAGETVTHAKALDLLESDAAVAAKAVKTDVHVPINQAQTDALISFTFSEGTGSLASSDLLKLLNAGNYSAVPRELMRWTYANGVKLPGLVARRHAEGLLFAHGTY
jgi:lysozyme